MAFSLVGNLTSGKLNLPDLTVLDMGQLYC